MPAFLVFICVSRHPRWLVRNNYISPSKFIKAQKWDISLSCPSFLDSTSAKLKDRFKISPPRAVSGKTPTEPGGYWTFYRYLSGCFEDALRTVRYLKYHCSEGIRQSKCLEEGTIARTMSRKKVYMSMSQMNGRRSISTSDFTWGFDILDQSWIGTRKNV